MVWFSPVAEVVSVVTWVLSTIGLPGLLALMIVESFGLPPVPSEVVLPFSGFLVAEGVFPFAGTVAVAVVGGLIGAYAAYGVGRWGRHRITGLGLGRLRLEASHLERMDRFFARHGEGTVALARLFPVVRSYISYPAGTAEMEPVRFGVYTTIGLTPFALALVYAGVVLGHDWNAVSAALVYFNYPLLALVAAGVVYLILMVGGWVVPGWPPRWRSRTARKVAPPTDAPGTLPPPG